METVPTEQQPFPSSQEDHLSPSERRPTGSRSLHWPTLPQKSSLGHGAAVLKYCFCCRHCTLPIPVPHPIPLSAVPPIAALLATFSGWSWVARNYRVAFRAAAAVRAHGLGDRKELSASRKQDSSCTHDTQKLERAFSQEKPSDTQQNQDCGSIWSLCLKIQKKMLDMHVSLFMLVTATLV